MMIFKEVIASIECKSYFATIMALRQVDKDTTELHLQEVPLKARDLLLS